MYLIGLFVWIVMAAFLARGFALLLTVRTKSAWVKRLTVLVLLPLVFIAPLADEVVGKFQFDRLCEAAKDVKTYGTIPVGDDLYTPEGKWRLDTADDKMSLGKIVGSYFRWDHGDDHPGVVPSVAIPIYERHVKLYEKGSDRLLAEWRVYSTPGGWFSQSFEMPFLVRHKCEPALARGIGIQKTILVFRKLEKEAK